MFSLRDDRSVFEARSTRSATRDRNLESSDQDEKKRGDRFALMLTGAVSSGAGELGEQHSFGMRGRVRASSRQDRHAASTAGGDHPSGEGDRIGTELFIYTIATNYRFHFLTADRHALTPAVSLLISSHKRFFVTDTGSDSAGSARP